MSYYDCFSQAESFPKSVSVPHPHIWIVGSSIIKRAFCYGRSQGHNGSQLGLETEVDILWQGRSGLKWQQLVPMLKHLLTIGETPNFLIIHCGGNSIGLSSTYELIFRMKEDVNRIIKMFPRTVIIWSQILPRLSWRGHIEHYAMEKARRRVNNGVASYILGLGGKYLRYPDITDKDCSFYLSDGVHLSDLGNKLFINTIKQGLMHFTSGRIDVYPDSGQSGHAS